MSERDPVVEVLDRARALSLAKLAAVFARYGRPLEDETVTLDPIVTLAPGGELGRLRYRAPVDVIANDHFVLRHDGQTLAMPGPLFAAVIAALTRD